jgi:hypothetical protein
MASYPARLEREVLEPISVVEHQWSNVVDAYGGHLLQVSLE